MEPQHQQQNSEDVTHNNNNNHENTSNYKNNFLCRQSSTRWTPTSDQIRILKDLYYNNGVRSPSAEQIQKISARLRQYGKIEGKNVFYWFQNHKARERQKKRFNTSCPNTGNASSVEFPSVVYNKYPTITPAGFPSSSSSCSPSGVVGVGSYAYGYGSVTMEKSFRDCSISAGGGTLVGHNMWVGDQNHYSSSSYHHFIDHHQRKVTPIEDIQEDDQDDDDNASHYHHEQTEIETLPLFPLSGGGCFKTDSDSCYATWHHFPGSDQMACSRSTSLELSLNSYTGRY